MPIKTSRTSPLQIAEILLGKEEGRLGLTLCPGKKDPAYQWDRDLRTDVKAIRAWGASTVVTLIEHHEFQLLAIETLEQEVRSHGMDWWRVAYWSSGGVTRARPSTVFGRCGRMRSKQPHRSAMSWRGRPEPSTHRRGPHHAPSGRKDVKVRR